MQGRRKTGRTLGEHEIFGDEEAAKLQAEVIELRQMVLDLSAQVHAQFTTISAHAEIAREQVEFARDEARADLERTRELLIRLVERTREDLSDSEGFRIPGHRPGPSTIVNAERLQAVESRLGEALARRRTLLRAPAGAGRHDGSVDRHGVGRTARRARRRPQPRLTTTESLSARARCGSRRRPTRDPSAGGRSHGRRPRRAVQSIAAASYMCTTPAPSGGTRLITSSMPGQLGADQLEPLDAARPRGTAMIFSGSSPFMCVNDSEALAL